MNLALFFEGTGQGVHGKKTNVSLVYEQCLVDSVAQLCHLENGPGAKVGSWFVGGVAGVGWRVIFARARRWFEQNYFVHSTPTPTLYTSPQVFLFGFSRGALLARHFAAWLNKLGVEVTYLGLWDTVDAIPDLEVSETCPENVRHARHAVSEHEARRFFAYVPLRAPKKALPRGGLYPFVPLVEEELFPGSHSDVGGLYEDDHTLADLARAWIVSAAVERGLMVKDAIPVDNKGEIELLRCAIRHDSLRLASNLWGLIRPLRRQFPKSLKRHFSVQATAATAASI